MSYEDLREAGAKRATKEKATANKGKRGPKRKSPTPGAEVESEVQADSLMIVKSPSLPKAKVARMGEPAKTSEAL
ncbi:hypothetical protein ACLMJK_003819 [Lecanora helva]